VVAIIQIITGIVSRALSEKTTADLKMTVSMGGLLLQLLKLKQEKRSLIELVNTDNSMLTDGGGWHQLASDELGLDYRIAPERSK